MYGVVIIDKPAGITSHDVVNRVRRALGTRRVGHTGTLDPFATGVMVVLVGKATRLAQFLDKDEKEYEALVRFGFETDTGDVTGVRSAECGVRSDEMAAILASTEWEDVFSEFRGEIEQVPPMYSAKKIEGKKLYQHARKGETVERQPIMLTISALDVIGPGPTPDSITIRVVCSAGTYLRTLAEDIGRALGTGAHLVELRRTRAGQFDLSKAVTLDELETSAEPASLVLPVGDAIAHLSAITLPTERAAATRKGLSTRITDSEFADGESVRMLDNSEMLLAVGVYDQSERSIRPKVVLE
jgi:tRNA pseudouridine55 synthase